MSSSTGESATRSSEKAEATQKKYKGIRRRKWGKWVSEIRIPATPERLWLGSYVTPEAAAVAHDVACYCLRGNSSAHNFNFPLDLPAGARVGLSPGSVQKVASDAGMAIDARLLDLGSENAEDLKDQGKSVEKQSAWSESDDCDYGSSDWWRKTDEDHPSISVKDYLG